MCALHLIRHLTYRTAFCANIITLFTRSSFVTQSLSTSSSICSQHPTFSKSSHSQTRLFTQHTVPFMSRHHDLSSTEITNIQPSTNNPDVKPLNIEQKNSNPIEAPLINEEEIEEKFVRGAGPGGQKINKTASCVILKHIPSGIIVKCQQSRSQVKNRQLARKLLQRKLDEVVRGEQSEAAKDLKKARARKAKRRRKSVKKHAKVAEENALLTEE